MKSQQLDFFHNTIGLLPSEKIEREAKAIRQVDRVLEVFKQNPNQDFTPTQIFLMFGQQYPLTSIRRSITDLTSAGDLVKTDNMRAGMFGEKNYCWQYAKKDLTKPQ